MNEPYRIEKNKLILPSGSISTFDFPIGQVLTTDEIFIVRLEPPAGAAYNENVFAVDASGRILWRVPQEKTVYPDSPYTGMTIEAGRLKLGNWDGSDLFVDPKTGKILSRGYSK